MPHVRPKPDALVWIVTNYEFIRRAARLKPLLEDPAVFTDLEQKTGPNPRPVTGGRRPPDNREVGVLDIRVERLDPDLELQRSGWELLDDLA